MEWYHCLEETGRFISMPHILYSVTLMSFLSSHMGLVPSWCCCILVCIPRVKV
jgi:hypothetical protein